MSASNQFDALLPEAIAEKAEAVGVAKAERGTISLLVLSILAGAFIALGAMLATLTATGLDSDLPFGITRILPGLMFSLGLILVVVCGAELFTGDVLMTIAWAGGRLRLSTMLRAWAVILVGNLIGAVGTAILVYLSGHWMMGDMQVGVTATRVAIDKAGLSPGHAFWRGVLCNVLVCLAVWGSLAARSLTDRILIVVPPVTAFVAAGFEHSIANFYYLALGWLLTHRPGLVDEFAASELDKLAGAIHGGDVLASQIAVLAGNLAGGALLVALTYWLAYLRPTRRTGMPAHSPKPADPLPPKT